MFLQKERSWLKSGTRIGFLKTGNIQGLKNKDNKKFALIQKIWGNVKLKLNKIL